MRVLVTGASGFLGRHVVAELGKRRHEVLRLTRGPLDPADPRLKRWDPDQAWIDPEALTGLDAVIHLAGESIAGARWNEAVKARLLDSRVRGTKVLVDALASRSDRPKVLLAASAVGLYGERGDEDLDESSPAGAGFLAELCGRWESEAGRVTALGVREVRLRLGMVLGSEGGALRKMLPPFRLGLGGRLGSGRQWMSWIAMRDAVDATLFLMEREDASGPYNLCAPLPATNAQFTQSLGRALGRPARLPVPAFALRLAYGEMADALLLAGQKALPRRLKDAGFNWSQPYLGEALNHLVRT